MNPKGVRIFAAALLAGSTLFPATQASANTSAEYFRARMANTNVPELLSKGEREYYADLFRAIDREEWTRVDQLLKDRPDGPLHQVATAEFYTAATSPAVTAEQAAAWLDKGTLLPQSEQIGRIGLKRGLETLPAMPSERSFQRQPYATKRILPRTVSDGTMPETVRSEILERIKNDDPGGARLLLDGIDASLSSEARAEWRQRVAWSYYIENNDAAALGMARTVADGSGAWVAEGEWVAGLAAWRLGDCKLSGDSFARSAAQATNPELTSAAHFWAGRAYTRCRQPADADKHLRAAARFDETLYGMLAFEQLGIDLPAQHAAADFTPEDWQKLRDEPNIRVAVALNEIGQSGLADEVLRHQARIGDPRDYGALSRLARELGMPQTQLWMAHNAPYGTRAEPALRFPTAKWTPTTGWQVDPALAFAHALQESNFRTRAVSPANARGLMQITPITVRQHAPRLEMNASYVNLNDPEVNLAFGQRNLKMLRDDPATQGYLPKIMAAYNAGLTPISRWNYEVKDQDDPLLYMESIPYWETRGYVAIVMRNYWMYERQAGVRSPSREALAQGIWPLFPDLASQRMAGGRDANRP
ncbi:lytic transglycosylase domain-containing protein [Altererythrobacter arenosus]|uniref:Lytic transglycosylase domain-containing protein n=1 Tax=Altererythrobacter arenosus TaxID=3032592 RepID=A0ABY8FUY3_9SPHN|nr:lytic transglycosylase domain-containing protein [Altererythrobacter sp. CAU 1644]WFL77206.1 lytic transglycosylase domain-containing protein [Altererythrobacter sp. CAU 1644]